MPTSSVPDKQVVSEHVQLIFIITCVKNYLEDRVRHKSDAALNSRPVRRLTMDESGARTKAVHWSDVQCGDILMIEDQAEFCADGIILASSEDDGRCFVETANLDGETNLKPLFASKAELSTAQKTREELSSLIP